MDRLPHFFIIGAMKAATSSLHDQLAAIDGVFMSDPKELYFFSDDPVYAKGIHWYASHFADASDDQVLGESTTHYAKRPTYPHTLERIAHHIEDPRFVYVMRHPIDRLKSQYTHMWLEREITVSFAEAVDGAAPELVDYSRYSYQLEPFLERFGPDRVLPVFFDRLRTHGTAELRRVCRFIGLDEAALAVVEWDDEIGANNVSSERLQQSVLRTTLKRVPGYDVARKLIPETGIERIRDRWRPSETPDLTHDQTRRLTQILDRDLSALGGWLGIDLTVENFVQTTAELAEPAWQPALSERFPRTATPDVQTW